MIRMTACAVLEDAGFRTLDAGDSDEALDELIEHAASVTLLFTGIDMPGSRNGFELGREVARLTRSVGEVDLRPGHSRHRPASTRVRISASSLTPAIIGQVAVADGGPSRHPRS